MEIEISYNPSTEEPEKEELVDILDSNGYEPTLIETEDENNSLKIVIRYNKDNDDEEDEVDAVADLLSSEGYNPIIESVKE